MSTATVPSDMSENPQTHPSISIYISTGTSTFDLSLETPFAITVNLTLDFQHPITFQTREAPFFRSPLGDPGLVFTNIRNGEKQIGSRVSVHYISTNDGGLPTEANRESWFTLFPGQAHTLDATIQPMRGESRMRTLAEMKSGADQRSLTKKWPLANKLLNKEVYEISVSEDARIKRWIMGDLAQILDLKRSNVSPTVRNEVIMFEVKETTRFEVKRPDRDGSLNWP